MTRSCLFVLVSILTGVCQFQQCIAATFGGITPSNGQILAQQVESLYIALIRAGQVPVVYATIEKDDTIEKIMRRQSAFTGAYFPVLLDALTCDLNQKYCSRPIVLPKKTGITKISSPLELPSTAGNWGSLQIGSKILIPKVHVDKNIVPRQYIKSSFDSIRSMIAENEVCLGEQMAFDECAKLFNYMNYTKSFYSQDGFSGPIFIPSYNYIISIPKDCKSLCAKVSGSILLDPTTNRFLSGPYDILTTSTQPDPSSDESLANEERVILVRPEAEGNDENLLKQPQALDSIPPEIARKLGTADSLLNQNMWRKTTPYKPFSEALAAATPAGPFNAEKQISLLKGINYPVSQLQPISEQFSNNGTQQSVLILDSKFDRSHCKFSDRIKVYDCQNKDHKDPPECKLKETGFTYDVAGTQTLAVKDDAGLVSKAKASGCGAADLVDVESPVPSSIYIAPRHGTHLAGIIGAKWDGFALGGINPFATLIGVETDMERLSDEAYGRWLLKRIKQIMFHENVRVVNVSAGYTPLPSPSVDGNGDAKLDWLTTLIRDTRDQAVFIAAAGNQPDPGCKTIPACNSDRDKNVISVVALNNSGDGKWLDASTNSRFSVGAPAENVFGTMPLNKYGYMSGSSQAAAIVSGTISLAMSLGTGALWPPVAIRNRAIACSNIKKNDMVSLMLGGVIDVDCFIHGSGDQIQVDGSSETVNGSIVNPCGGTPCVKFMDVNNGSLFLDANRILGFQRIEGDPNDISLLYAKTVDLYSGSIEKMRGQFDGGQFMNLMVKDKIIKYPVDKISRFARRTP